MTSQVDYEEIVFMEIRDYLNKNKTMKVNKLIPYLTGVFAKKSVNINKEGIASILKSLIQNNVIVEGSKLTRDEVLSNPKRNRIYEFITQNPGTYYYQIIKELNFGNHLVIWHVNILLEFKFIGVIEEDNHELFYHIDISPEMAKRVYYMTNEKSKMILDYLKSHIMGASKTEISRNLDMHPNTVKKYIGILEKMQLVHSIKESNKILYFLNE